MMNYSPLRQKGSYNVGQSRMSQDAQPNLKQQNAFTNQQQLNTSQHQKIQSQTLQVNTTTQQQNVVSQQSFQSIRSVRVNQVSTRSIHQQSEAQVSTTNVIVPAQQQPLQQSQQIRREGPRSLRNYITSSPQGPLSHKSNKSFSLSRPAFVEYYPPVYMPHVEPIYKQTIIENPIKVVDLVRFEEMWSKRMRGIEEMLETKNQVIVQSENFELRAQNNPDSQTIIDLQNELFRVKTQLEERERQIQLMKQQLQNARDQIEFESKQNRSASNILTSELNIKITNLQQTISNLQIDLKSVQEMAEKYKLENFQLKAELQQNSSMLNGKDEIIMKLKQQLKSSLDQYNLDAQSGKNVSQQIINELQFKLNSLQQTITSQQLNLNSKDDLIEKLRMEINQLRQERQHMQDLCNQKDDTISKLQMELNELYQQVDQLTEEITTTQSVKTYEEEAKIWKQKFKELNDTYHACQEKLMVKEAEYESLSKQHSQQKIVTSTTVIKQNSSRNVLNNSEYTQSSFTQNNFTQNEFDKLQTLQKPLMM
ncbi:unnamed protein product (macronuclear) [Paramecium tetraurelia]|uniref:Uncharacterized protein n=1 Tax=Paramecium tetraurelia TaxID=5888 RepID=A0CVX4_PARTE|nr:uncharacterized protein GSPATT00001143001 [Paramecium tetraurelia]CAK74941.1 unnamed protein product [Paramecium tetraurelia]|eukprot:XP_001442338.1 hypothetical protein (macronuclear) [Paramecium tetraurelia strain d4-2]